MYVCNASVKWVFFLPKMQQVRPTFYRAEKKNQNLKLVWGRNTTSPTCSRHTMRTNSTNATRGILGKLIILWRDVLTNETGLAFFSTSHLFYVGCNRFPGESKPKVWVCSTSTCSSCLDESAKNIYKNSFLTCPETHFFKFRIGKKLEFYYFQVLSFWAIWHFLLFVFLLL